MSDTRLQNPEVLLHGLVRVGLNLRGAMSILDKPELKDRMTDILRRLVVADLLSRTWVIAIGGSQGAGKTTLVQSMYGFDHEGDEAVKWLPDNEGRGESLPVLLLEDDQLSEPQGYLRRLVENDGIASIEDKKVSSQEFRAAAASRGEECLFPVLRLPRRYFSEPNQGFLLLPGYEVEHEENSTWQALMRQGMVGAAACIFVTDKTRLANAQQLEMLKDIHKAQLAGNVPIVVISKTEKDSDELRQQQRDTAAQVFDISDDLRQTFILCTGTGADYIKNWQPALLWAVRQVASGSGAVRVRQMDHLETLIQRDLGRLLADIRAAFAVDVSSDVSENSRMLSEYMDKFDESCNSLREKYLKELTFYLQDHFNKAWSVLNQTLISEHEGFGNKLKNFGDTVGEREQKLISAISDAWASPGTVSERHIQALESVTAKALKRVATSKKSLAPPNSNKELSCLDDEGGVETALTYESEHQLTRLGYVDNTGAAVSWNALDNEVLTTLSVLMTAGDQPLGNALDKTIKILPALALEFVRFGTVLPEVVGVDPKTLVPDVDVVEAAERVGKQFEKLGGIKSDIVKGIALTLAVEGGGAAVSGVMAASATALSAVVSMVAVGLLPYCVMQEVQRRDTNARDAAHRALIGIKEAHQAYFLDHFDDIMTHMRETLYNRVSTRFRLDEQMGRRDRLAKPLADMVSLKLDLEEQLGRRSNLLV